MSFVLPWWLSGCNPVDLTNDTKLREIIPIDDTRWHRKRHDIRIAIEALILTMQRFYDKLMVKQANLEKRNEIGRIALAEYRQKKFLQEKAIDNLDQRVSEGLKSLDGNMLLLDKDNRMDRVLPSMLPGHGENTPNSFKHRPPKPLGTLRDK